MARKIACSAQSWLFYVEYNFKVCCVFSFAFTPCLKRIVLKSGLVWWVDLEFEVGIKPD
jgi:hypothetical protein